MKMDLHINKLIIELQTALAEKYGTNFKKFYLTTHIEDKELWEGLISSKTEEGERNVEYFTLQNNIVIQDEKIFH